MPFDQSIIDFAIASKRLAYVRVCATHFGDKLQ